MSRENGGSRRNERPTLKILTRTAPRPGSPKDRKSLSAGVDLTNRAGPIWPRLGQTSGASIESCNADVDIDLRPRTKSFVDAIKQNKRPGSAWGSQHSLSDSSSRPAIHDVEGNWRAKCGTDSCRYQKPADGATSFSMDIKTSKPTPSFISSSYGSRSMSGMNGDPAAVNKISAATFGQIGRSSEEDRYVMGQTGKGRVLRPPVQDIEVEFRDDRRPLRSSSKKSVPIKIEFVEEDLDSKNDRKNVNQISANTFSNIGKSEDEVKYVMEVMPSWSSVVGGATRQRAGQLSQAAGRALGVGQMKHEGASAEPPNAEQPPIQQAVRSTVHDAIRAKIKNNIELTEEERELLRQKRRERRRQNYQNKKREKEERLRQKKVGSKAIKINVITHDILEKVKGKETHDAHSQQSSSATGAAKKGIRFQDEEYPDLIAAPARGRRTGKSVQCDGAGSFTTFDIESGSEWETDVSESILDPTSGSEWENDVSEGVLELDSGPETAWPRSSEKRTRQLSSNSCESLRDNPSSRGITSMGTASAAPSCSSAAISTSLSRSKDPRSEPQRKDLKKLKKNETSKVIESSKVVSRSSEQIRQQPARKAKASESKLRDEQVAPASAASSVLSYSSVLKRQPTLDDDASKTAGANKDDLPTGNRGKKAKDGAGSKGVDGQPDKGSKKAAPTKTNVTRKTPMTFDIGTALVKVKRGQKGGGGVAKTPMAQQLATGHKNSSKEDDRKLVQPSVLSGKAVKSAQKSIQLKTQVKARNMLDSTAPIRKRGKEKIGGKKKILSKMKKIIMKERQQKAAMLKAAADKMKLPDETKLTENSLDNPLSNEEVKTSLEPGEAIELPNGNQVTDALKTVKDPMIVEEKSLKIEDAFCSSTDLGETSPQSDCQTAANSGSSDPAPSVKSAVKLSTLQSVLSDDDPKSLLESSQNPKNAVERTDSDISPSKSCPTAVTQKNPSQNNHTGADQGVDSTSNRTMPSTSLSIVSKEAATSDAGRLTVEQLDATCMEADDMDSNKENLDGILKSNEALSVEERVRSSIHTRKFRSYCDQLLSSDLDASVKDLMSDILRFQDNQHAKDPLKAKIRRRYVVGLRETLKLIKVKKIVCVILAPDMEKISSEHGLDHTVEMIKDDCREQNVNVVFCLNRFRLAKVIRRPTQVSCIGLISYQGAVEKYKKMIELSEELRVEYKTKLDAAIDRIQNPQQLDSPKKKSGKRKGKKSNMASDDSPNLDAQCDSPAEDLKTDLEVKPLDSVSAEEYKDAFAKTLERLQTPREADSNKKGNKGAKVDKKIREHPKFRNVEIEFEQGSKPTSSKNNHATDDPETEASRQPSLGDVDDGTEVVSETDLKTESQSVKLKYLPGKEFYPRGFFQPDGLRNNCTENQPFWPVTGHSGPANSKRHQRGPRAAHRQARSHNGPNMAPHMGAYPPHLHHQGGYTPNHQQWMYNYPGAEQTWRMPSGAPPTSYTTTLNQQYY